MENNYNEIGENPSINLNNELENKSDIKTKIKHKKKKNKKSFWKWPLTVLFLTLILSTVFSLGSELILSSAGIAISIVLLLIFIFLATFCDMLGVAVTAAELEPFVAMSSRKIKASKEAMNLVKNADKFSSIICDVFGDIFGILSGTISASLVAIIAVNGEFMEILVASIISAIVAALTVFLKAVGKKIALKNSNKIIFAFAKFISFFKFRKKNKI